MTQIPKTNRILQGVCNTCHSPNGAFNGVNSVGSSIGAKNSWWVDAATENVTGDSKDYITLGLTVSQVYNADGSLKSGKEKWCAGCHDAGTSTIDNVAAPDIAGDNSTYGFYINGHKVSCTNCHNSTLSHFDANARTYAANSNPNNYQSGYRLKYSMKIPLLSGDGSAQDKFDLCFRCHTYQNVMDNTDPFDTNFRDEDDPLDPGDDSDPNINMHLNHSNDNAFLYWDSDFDYNPGEGTAGKTDSRVSCPACHNVHGSKTEQMIRSGELETNPGKTSKAPALDFRWYEANGVIETTTLAGSYYGDMPPTTNTQGTLADTKICDTCHNAPVEGKYYRTPLADAVGCGTCHSFPQGQSGERRVIVGASGDFIRTSHHVSGVVTDDDCLACHDQTYHLDGDPLTIPDPQVYLKNGDAGASYTYNGTNESLEPFCLSCHDSDGSDGDTTPFSDNKTVPNVDGVAGSMWADSAHKLINYSENGNQPVTCVGNGTTSGCHGNNSETNAHGSDNEKLLGGTSPTAIDSFCYRCHTQNKVMNNAISGSSIADDIEQAFGLGSKHNLGTLFTMDGNTFTLQCTTCHNPHLATGKYWDAENGKSPINRPDFSDPTNNPRAMGKSNWGGTGQKMKDYAALGLGTGGSPQDEGAQTGTQTWYYNVGQGRAFGGAAGTADKPAIYQPPKTSSGGFEFSGNDLPDYPSLCLDCHDSSKSSSVNWVNWNVNHGLSSANEPQAWGEVNKYGPGGNPGPVFNQVYSGQLPRRGRGGTHWTRYPYEPADRNAGANFVLSCTDCHEAHGSSVNARLLRGTINTGPGTIIWNTLCDNCHYYYGAQHFTGVSCGDVSCHASVSIHSMQAGGGNLNTNTYIWSPPQPPVIQSAQGAVGQSTVTVVFSEAAYATINESGGLNTESFDLTDIDDSRTITSVSHNAGSTIARLTLSSPLDASNDIDVDTVKARNGKVFDRDGTPVNPGNAPTTIIQTTIPAGADTFNFSEAAGSATIWDDQNIVSGSVNDAVNTILGNGYFTGDGVDNKVTFTNNNSAFLADTTLTLESRFKPTVNVNFDFNNSTGVKAMRVFERTPSNYQMSIWRTAQNSNYPNYNPAGDISSTTASIAFWLVPVNNYGSTSAPWSNSYKPILTDYRNYPIVPDHWYRVRVVWDTSKTDDIPGDHYFVPGDIYVDDQGTDGAGAGENWAGFKNATYKNQYQIDLGKLHISDTIIQNPANFYIGVNNSGSSNYFSGQIDSIKIDPSSLDYSGLDNVKISDATAYNGTGVPGVLDENDYVVINFNGPTAMTPVDSNNIDAALNLSDDHTWLDNEPFGNIGSAIWADSDTLIITLSNDLIQPPTVAPGDTITLGGILKDQFYIPMTDIETIIGSF